MTTRPDPCSSDWIALARYVSGEATREERVSLDTRAAADPAFAQLLSESVIGWSTASTPPRPRDKQAAWQAIVRHAPPARHPRLEAQVKKHPTQRGVWYGVAALVVCMVIVASWMAGVRHVSTRVARAALTYATANGERANITLPDGSTVALDVASRLTVPADYVAGNRTVRLDGEALFNVTHHDGGLFTVIAGATTARVLGTSFVVRHYATDTTTVVAVRDGKVAVGSTVARSSGARPLVLTAVQQAEIDQRGVARVGVADPAQFGFAVGVLTLNDVPFPRAIAELDRWYDAKIQLGDSALAAQRVTGEYAAGSLADLAAILGWTFDVRVVRNGRVLVLYPR